MGEYTRLESKLRAKGISNDDIFNASILKDNILLMKDMKNKLLKGYEKTGIFKTFDLFIVYTFLTLLYSIKIEMRWN